MTRAALLLVVTALGGAAQTVVQRTGQPPVVLINGWNLTCADSDTDSTGTFGRMEEFLRAQGREVLFFNNCQQGNDSSSIESLGQKLRDLLNGLHYLDGSPALPVDVVTHSMGGLVLRSYLSGKQESGYAFNPPLATGIRKVVFIATPYWGASFFDIAPNLKAVEMLQVSQFLWDLSSWNQDADDLRGIDAIGILGTAGLLMAGDGTVTLLSGISLPTRIVPYCHSGSVKLICVPGARFMSQVDDEQHLSWRIVNSFLNGTEEWRTLGTDPSRNSTLANRAQLCVSQKAADDMYYPPGGTDKTVTTAGAATFSAVSQSYAMCNLDLAKGPYDAAVTYQGQPVSTTHVDLTNTFGMTPLRLHLGAHIASVQSDVPAGPGRAVAAGSRITVQGAGFVAGTRVFVDGTELPVSNLTDTSFATQLPQLNPGLRQLKVQSPGGVHTVNILVFDMRPAAGVLVNAASYQAPVAPGSWATLFGSHLSAVTRIWTASDFVGGRLPQSLGGVTVKVGGQPAFLYYVSPEQVNLQVPQLSGAGPVSVEIATAAGTSTTSMTLAQSAPAFFLFGKYVTSGPAKPGDAVSLWLTGVGAQPAGVLIAAPVQLAPVQVTIGGRNAQMLYTGLVGPGLIQVNCIVPDVPDGEQPVSVGADGVTSQNTPPMVVRRSL